MSSSRSLLITGGAGFIGSNFVHHWRSAHPQDAIVVLDALTYAGNRGSLAALEHQQGFTFVRGDICDRELVAELLRRHAIRCVVHFAAESHVDRSILGPDEFVRTNVQGTHSMLEACRRVWLNEAPGPHRFHHVSTDEVYGSLAPEDPAFHESTPYAPNSPYAASKAAADHLVRAYFHTYRLQATTSNCSNNYGPYHFPEKLIPLAIINILSGKALPIYGDGRNVRDWLHVSDHCRGIELVIEGGRPGETYNLGGRCETENLALVRTLCRVADAAFRDDPALGQRFPMAPAARGESCESLISFVRDRPGHDRRYAIDCTKAERELGYACRTSLEDGLRRTFRWYLDNEAWWRSVTDGSYREWINRQYGPATGEGP